MPSGGSYISKEVLEEQTVREIFRNRFIIFIIGVSALVAAFAWNHLATVGIRDKLDDDPVRAAFLYAVLMTIIFVIIIFVFAIVFKKIYGF